MVRTTCENMKQDVPVCAGAKHTRVRRKAPAASNGTGVWTMRLISMIEGERDIRSHLQLRKCADHVDDTRAPGNEQLAAMNSLVVNKTTAARTPDHVAASKPGSIIENLLGTCWHQKPIQTLASEVLRMEISCLAGYLKWSSLGFIAAR
ncbi:hypothetical protein DFH08DRAFT_817551 [Mycena albidolilacea]|uniref:Uncharacterized protein n=1 Tax=Mycena albidolilacea TaxID=1033008 RepID=A0AAD7EID0_9AGAR|nr:hypothetical protein DFH08DRAFT_817551 [Mycena albidolilacea]